MASAYKCDVCGKLFDMNEASAFISDKNNKCVQTTYEWLIDMGKDFCPSCKIAFWNWIKERRASMVCGVPTDEY